MHKLIDILPCLEGGRIKWYYPKGANYKSSLSEFIKYIISYILYSVTELIRSSIVKEKIIDFKGRQTYISTLTLPHASNSSKYPFLSSMKWDNNRTSRPVLKIKYDGINTMLLIK